MLSRSKLELIGLQTIVTGLEMAAEVANENLRQAQDALATLKAQAEGVRQDHFIEARDVTAVRRGRPPKALSAATAESAEPAAPIVEHKTKRNYRLMREAGIKSSRPGPPTRADVARAEKILARRNGAPIVDNVQSARVKASYALIKQAGMELTHRGSPTREEMDEARRRIAEAGGTVPDFKIDSLGRKMPTAKRTLNEESRARVGASSRDRWQRAIHAGVDTGGRIPNKEALARSNHILAQLCKKAGVVIKGEVPTLAEVIKAERILKRGAGSQASHSSAEDVRAAATQ